MSLPRPGEHVGSSGQVPQPTNEGMSFVLPNINAASLIASLGGFPDSNEHDPLQMLASENATLRNQVAGLTTERDAEREENAELKDRVSELTLITRTERQTKMLNKGAFEEKVQGLIDSGVPFVVLEADIMNLKAVNDYEDDTLERSDGDEEAESMGGHEAGDRLIAETAAVFRFIDGAMDTFHLLGLQFHDMAIAHLGEEEIDESAGRLGGDEFAIVIPLQTMNTLTEERRQLALERLEHYELDLEILAEDPDAESEVIAHIRAHNFMYDPNILLKLQRGELSYTDMANLLYVQLQDVYRMQYLESDRAAGGIDLGQGIAAGFAIFDPSQPGAENVTAKSICKKADIMMYKDKAQQKEILGHYDRVTKERRGGTDRRDADRGEDNRRSGFERRGTASQLGKVLMENTSMSTVLPKILE